MLPLPALSLQFVSQKALAIQLSLEVFPSLKTVFIVAVSCLEGIGDRLVRCFYFGFVGESSCADFVLVEEGLRRLSALHFEGVLLAASSFIVGTLVGLLHFVDTYNKVFNLFLVP